MIGVASKKDFLLVSIIGIIFGAFAIPILENINPSGWRLTFVSAAILIGGFFIFANFAIFIAGLIGKKIPSLFQFAKYAATGAMNSFTDLGLFNWLTMIFQIFSGPLIIVINTISFSIAVTNSYFWNNLWAFKREGGKLSIAEFGKFLGVTIGGVILNNLIVYVVTTVIGAPDEVTPQLWENAAKLFGVPVAIMWNFFGYKYFVFKLPLAKNL
ncbi:MAG: GtrA family protein [Candidatus Harrisonbacteria bacterium]|nr:GtrA family protein [Candidatus Harrisonbacteria bacterium]